MEILHVVLAIGLLELFGIALLFYQHNKDKS